MAKRYSAKLKFQVTTELLTGDKTPAQTLSPSGQEVESDRMDGANIKGYQLPATY